MTTAAPAASSGASGITVANLSKTYQRGKVRALDAVSLSIAPGEVFGLIGPNGAGKTTFLGCLLGLLHFEGNISIDGRPPDDLSIRYVTGYLPERLNFDRWMTGRSFLRYHHRLAGLPRVRMDDDVREALRRVGLDDVAAARTIRKYSRGMLQRLGFAQALLGSPRYLFLDEPASGVDPLGVLIFRDILREAKAQEVTVVLNSHQLDQVERVCDRVAFVKDGKVEAIEVLQAGAELTRALRVRWSAGFSPADRLAAAASQAAVELVHADAREAQFLVGSDNAAAALIRALVAHEIPVIEVTSEHGRLERLFLENGKEANGR